MDVIKEIQKNPHFPFTLKKARGKLERDKLVLRGYFFQRTIVYWVLSLACLVLALSFLSRPVESWAMAFAIIFLFAAIKSDAIYSIIIEEVMTDSGWKRVCKFKIRQFILKNSAELDLSIKPGQLYIRLRQTQIWCKHKYSYHLALGVAERTPFRFTNDISDLKMARLLGRQIASTLKVDYFDYEDVSDEHVLVSK